MRTKFLVVLAVAFVAVVAASCDWPSFRGDAAHNGFSPFENKVSASNVSTLTTAFTARLSSIAGPPVVADGAVLLVDGAVLKAFSATGSTNCSGTPPTCQPLWTATLPTGGFPVPTVSNGVLYVAAGTLYAFDAHGATNCSGSPKVCDPLWQAPSASSQYPPTVANGEVIVTGGIGIQAFDAAGNTNCSGSPTTCSPLWTAAASGASGSPSYSSNGTVFVGGTRNLYAFDLSGDPLWTAPIGTNAAPGTAAVSSGMVYIVNATSGTLYAFDDHGQIGCSGTPKTCAPEWTASSAAGSPAVTGGAVFIGNAAFDATGTTNCSGSPKVCTPIRTYNPVGVPNTFGGPIVANDVLYTTSMSDPGGGLTAFDANGTNGCSGAPVVCSPLFTETSGSGVEGDASVADGIVYFAAGDPFGSTHELFALTIPSSS